MNTPSPLIPQGSLLDQKNKSRARVKVAFFAVVGAHVAAILVALLAQGCKRDTAGAGGGTLPEASQPIVPETNYPPFVEPTNTIVETAPANTPIATDPGFVQPSGTQTITTVTPPGGPTGQSQEYAIQKGDSFSSIAGKHPGVTVRAIQDANPNVNPTRLQIGQKIVIPAPSAAPAAATGSGNGTPAPAAGETTYVVKAGDNLTKIASSHNTTVNAIRRANNMSTDRIKVGDKLKIPSR